MTVPMRHLAVPAALSAATALATAAAPAAATPPAHAAIATTPATIAVDRPCYVRTGAAAPRMHLTGSGFAAGGQVTITDSTGTLDATTTAAADGSVDASFAGPGLVLRRPGQVGDTITATERTGASTRVVGHTQTRVSILGAAHGSTDTARGLKALRDRTSWVFSGWPSGRPIYVHYLQHHRQVARARFGRAGGPCGVLSVHRALFPTRPRASSYATQVDTLFAYRTSARPRITALRVGLQFEF